MIQNHPICPKSAMEKYYMEQQLPKYQKLPPQQTQKKNHLYYHDNSNIWNNQHQSSSNMKLFAKIQEQKLSGGKHIQQLKKQKHKGQQQQQTSKHNYFNQLKNEDRKIVNQNVLALKILVNNHQILKQINTNQTNIIQYYFVRKILEYQQIQKYLPQKWKQLNLLRNTQKRIYS